VSLRQCYTRIARVTFALSPPAEEEPGGAPAGYLQQARRVRLDRAEHRLKGLTTGQHEPDFLNVLERLAGSRAEKLKWHTKIIC
jgi:hypothetical protein